MLLSRRTFALSVATTPLLALQIPSSTTPQSSDSNVVELPSSGVCGISPTGETLLQVTEDLRLAFLDTATLEITSESEPLPALEFLDSFSVDWSVDEQSVAFSLLATQGFRESDIFVANRESATITNLTPDGHEDESATYGLRDAVRLDTFPKWTSDPNKLIFFSFPLGDRIPEGRRILEFTIDTEDVVSWASLGEDLNEPMNANPMWLLPDESILFSRWGDSESQIYQVFQVARDGTKEQLAIGDLTHAFIGSGTPDNSSVLLWGGTQPDDYRYWQYEPLERTVSGPLNDTLLQDANELFIHPPAPGESITDLVYSVVTTANEVEVRRSLDGIIEPVAALGAYDDGNPLRNVRRAGSYLLLMHDSSSVLVNFG